MAAVSNDLIEQLLICSKTMEARAINIHSANLDAKSGLHAQVKVVIQTIRDLFDFYKHDLETTVSEFLRREEAAINDLARARKDCERAASSKRQKAAVDELVACCSYVPQVAAVTASFDLNFFGDLFHNLAADFLTMSRNINSKMPAKRCSVTLSDSEEEDVFICPILANRPLQPASAQLAKPPQTAKCLRAKVHPRIDIAASKRMIRASTSSNFMRKRPSAPNINNNSFSDYSKRLDRPPLVLQNPRNQPVEASVISVENHPEKKPSSIATTPSSDLSNKENNGPSNTATSVKLKDEGHWVCPIPAIEAKTYQAVTEMVEPKHSSSLTQRQSSTECASEKNIAIDANNTTASMPPLHVRPTAACAGPPIFYSSTTAAPPFPFIASAFHSNHFGISPFRPLPIFSTSNLTNNLGFSIPPFPFGASIPTFPFGPGGFPSFSFPLASGNMPNIPIPTTYPHFYVNHRPTSVLLPSAGVAADDNLSCVSSSTATSSGALSWLIYDDEDLPSFDHNLNDHIFVFDAINWNGSDLDSDTMREILNLDELELPKNDSKNEDRSRSTSEATLNNDTSDTIDTNPLEPEPKRSSSIEESMKNAGQSSSSEIQRGVGQSYLRGIRNKLIGIDANLSQ